MLHGKLAAEKAEQTAKNTFEKRSVGDDLPTININKNDLSSGINIVDLVVKAKLLNSKSEVRRTIINKGIKLNNETVEDDKLNVSINNFSNDNILKLSYGKKNHVVLKLI
jgi:tyrosyl-tRNA synthetase